MKKIAQLLIVLVIVACVGIILRSFLRHRAPPTQTAQIEVDRFIQLIDEKLSLPVRTDALLVLAKQKDDRVLPIATEWLKSETKILQFSAIQALGEFQDSLFLTEVKKVWLSMPNDAQLKVLAALAAHPSDMRKAWLNELASDQNISVRAGAELFMAKINSEPTVWLKKVSADFSKLDEPTQMRMIDIMMLNFAQNAEVIQLQENLIQKTQSMQLKAAAIRNLATQKVESLAKQLSKLAQDKAYEVRAAAIEAIPLLCPKDRWVILQQRAQIESNGVVLHRLLDVLSSLKGPQAEKTLKSFEPRVAKLTPDLKAKASETRKDLTAPPPTNRCD